MINLEGFNTDHDEIVAFPGVLKCFIVCWVANSYYILRHHCTIPADIYCHLKVIQISQPLLLTVRISGTGATLLLA